jgi:hypothetical protein
MPRLTSTLQTIAIATVCALLTAKFPSFAEHQSTGFSVAGAGIGAAVALFAIFIGSQFSPPNDELEALGSPLEMQLLKAAVIAFCAAISSFTVMLYFPLSEWLRTVIGISVVAGVVCVFAGLAVKFLPSTVRDE